MSPPIVVADFDVAGAPPSPREVVDAALRRGATMLAVDVEDGDGDHPDAMLRGGGRIARLAKLADEARRRGVGLALRLRDTLAISGLLEALDVAKGATPTSLHDRVLVVVADDRIGKRLRREARELPSAYEIETAPRTKWSLARLAPPNFRRAAADCDDLVAPWPLRDAQAVGALAAKLARRSARLWIAEVPESDVARAATLPVAGFFVRFRHDE